MQVTSLMSRGDEAPVTPGVESSGDLLKGSLRVAFVGLILLASDWILTWMDPRNGAVGALLSMGGAVMLSAPILKQSMGDLRRGVVSINELVSLAVLASFVTGDYKTAGFVAFFMLAGEIIETRTAAGARASIESLIKLTPTRARRVVVGGGEEEVNTRDLAVGDVIRVRPGDNIAGDGVIVAGGSSINQASITGESLPVDRGFGEEVFAGTINLTGVLDIRVSRAGEDTTLGRVRDLILAAEQSKLPVMRLMDEYMRYYTPLVLTLGAMVWLMSKDLERVISVLVVACPCAFILATPTAMVAALSASARLGVLIKNVSDIELAARINAFVFDKTGTLTTGTMVVCRMVPMGGIGATELVRIAASVEQHSHHPTARALVRLASEVMVPLGEPTEFHEAAGRGIRARFEGRRVVVGRARWLLEEGIAPGFDTGVDLDEVRGFSLIFVAVDGQCLGWFGLQDQVREGAAEAVKELKSMGVKRVAMVTGDRAPVADRVARSLGIEEVAADCLPKDKVSFVEAVRHTGLCVAVVGDGVNDAPALAAGDVGIAMGAVGSEVAIHTATIALMNNELARLPFLIGLSRATRRVIQQNFCIGLVFIVGGLGLAAVGWLNPIVAAFLHNAGSLLVVFNSARLVRHGEGQDRMQSAPSLADQGEEDEWAPSPVS